MSIKNKKRAFTLIELIFVIVILGILASVAIPNFSGTVDNAYVAKAQAKVDTVRSGLQNYRSTSILKGNGATYPSSLDKDDKLFAVVAEGEDNSTEVGKWSADGNVYIYHTRGENIVFEYNATKGTFECKFPESLCNRFE